MSKYGKLAQTELLKAYKHTNFWYCDSSQEKTTRKKRQLATKDNSKFKESDNSQVFEANWKLYVLGSMSAMGALRARRRFAAITGSKFCIKSYSCVGKLATRWRDCGDEYTGSCFFMRVFFFCELSHYRIFERLLSGKR